MLAYAHTPAGARALAEMSSALYPNARSFSYTTCAIVICAARQPMDTCGGGAPYVVRAREREEGRARRERERRARARVRAGLGVGGGLCAARAVHGVLVDGLVE
jgi:hypothetical protein